MEKAEEETILQIAAIRKLRSANLNDWERNFIESVEIQLKRGKLTEKQKIWIRKLKEKHLK